MSDSIERSIRKGPRESRDSVEVERFPKDAMYQPCMRERGESPWEKSLTKAIAKVETDIAGID